MSRTPSAMPLWRPELRWAVAILLTGAMVPNIFVVAPTLLTRQGATRAELGLVMGAYQLAVLAMTPWVVPLARRLGYPVVLALGGGCGVLGAAGFVSWTEPPWLWGLMATRGLQGVGFAIAMVAVSGLVAERCSDRLGEALGVTSVTLLVAQAWAPVVANEATVVVGLRRALWLAAPLAACSMGLAVLLRLRGDAMRAAPASAAARGRVFTLRGELGAGLVGLWAGGLGFGTVWLFIADMAAQRRMGIGGFFAAYVIAALATRWQLGRWFERLPRAGLAASLLIAQAVLLAALARCDRNALLLLVGLGYGASHAGFYPTLVAYAAEARPAARAQATAAASFAFGVGILVAGWGLGPLAEAWGYVAMYGVAAGVALSGAAVLGLRRR